MRGPARKPLRLPRACVVFPEPESRACHCQPRYRNLVTKLCISARIVLAGVMAVLTFISGAWATLALRYQLPGGAAGRTAGSVKWMLMVVALAMVAVVRSSWLAVGAYALVYAELLIWWVSIAPSDDRVWADDVSLPLTGEISGSNVTLRQVRNFDRRSDGDYGAHWETPSIRSGRGSRRTDG
jgi:hypothetical protein